MSNIEVFFARTEDEKWFYDLEIQVYGDDMDMSLLYTFFVFNNLLYVDEYLVPYEKTIGILFTKPEWYFKSEFMIDKGKEPEYVHENIFNEKELRILINKISKFENYKGNLIKNLEKRLKEINKRHAENKLIEIDKISFLNIFIKSYMSGFQCAYCGRRMSLERTKDGRLWTIDHALPINNKKYSHHQKENLDNLLIVCERCNRLKLTSEPFFFKDIIDYIKKKYPQDWDEKIQEWYRGGLNESERVG